MPIFSAPAHPQALGRSGSTQRLFVGLVAGLAAGASMATTTVLAPQYTGSFGIGTGADASFVQIDSAWHGSTVLWDEDTRSYGTGDPIGSFAWGTGIWGQADWTTVQLAAAGNGGPGAPPVVASWSGLVAGINYANSLYNTNHSPRWGEAELAPIFTEGEGAQENWTARFTGFLNVTTAGVYDISVLNDDGFFLRLVGAGGATLETGRDFLNARDRDAFDTLLDLSVGLYGFELGSWNRLEAGVVDLRWIEPGSDTWTLIPTTNLLPVSAVPEPGAALLLALGLAGLALRLRSGGRTRA